MKDYYCPECNDEMESELLKEELDLRNDYLGVTVGCWCNHCNDYYYFEEEYKLQNIRFDWEKEKE